VSGAGDHVGHSVSDLLVAVARVAVVPIVRTRTQDGLGEVGSPPVQAQLFEPRERAALAWTEALTHLPAQGVPDDVYERVRTQLSEKEISDLSFMIMANNGWNRINAGFHTTPGKADAAYGLDKAGLK